MALSEPAEFCRNANSKFFVCIERAMLTVRRNGGKVMGLDYYQLACASEKWLVGQYTYSGSSLAANLDFILEARALERARRALDVPL